MSALLYDYRSGPAYQPPTKVTTSTLAELMEMTPFQGRTVLVKHPAAAAGVEAMRITTTGAGGARVIMNWGTAAGTAPRRPVASVVVDSPASSNPAVTATELTNPIGVIIPAAMTSVTLVAGVETATVTVPLTAGLPQALIKLGAGIMWVWDRALTVPQLIESARVLGAV